MLIPLRGDAVVFYRGWGTLGLMALTTVLFFVGDPVRDQHVWVLEFGRILPWQWVTHVFAHGSVFHLLANMLFLFWFGQIVEGRLGWLKFVPLYLALAAMEGLLVQCLRLGAGGADAAPGAIGSSGVIYGLMVIALFWAPRARFTCFLFVWWLGGVVEVSVLLLAAVYLALQALGAILLGFQLDTPVLHLIGAVVGLVPAAFLQRTGWVYLGDWEGLIDPFGARERKAPVATSGDPAVLRERERREVEKEIEGHLRAEEGAAALACHLRAAARLGAFNLPAPTERWLIRTLSDQGMPREAVARARAYLERRLPGSDQVRVRLAELLVRALRRPRQGLAVLAGIDRMHLPSSLAGEVRRVEGVANRLISEGTLEADS